jgi:hypothetical protein
MLGTPNIIPPPVVKDPTTKVRIKVPMYVGGKAHEVGSTAMMSRSDAEALRSVGRCEII